MKFILAIALLCLVLCDLSSTKETLVTAPYTIGANTPPTATGATPKGTTPTPSATAATPELISDASKGTAPPPTGSTIDANAPPSTAIGAIPKEAAATPSATAATPELISNAPKGTAPPPTGSTIDANAAPSTAIGATPTEAAATAATPSATVTAPNQSTTTSDKRARRINNCTKKCVEIGVLVAKIEDPEEKKKACRKYCIKIISA